MNVLFLSMVKINSISEGGIYADVLKAFVECGHNVYVTTPLQKREGKPTFFAHDGNAHFLCVRTGNLQNVNLIEKGISTILLEGQFVRAIKKHLSDVKIDLILYSTPPITFEKVVKYVKKRDGAKTYLLLKDIFPQNAADIGIMPKSGVKGLLYKYFRRKEKKLYAISDRIGCMSQANVDYVLKHNPEVPSSKAEICPNSIEIFDKSVTYEERVELRNKYGIPLDKKVFIYGGNLGRPQGIPFILDCLRAEKDNENAYFLIVGNGTEYGKVNAFVDTEKSQNVKLLQRLPKEDYDKLVASCDVGMVFLDHRFTIPNFPSRILSYMQAKLPVLACTDPNTDVGETIKQGNFGWWCESNDVNAFSEQVSSAIAQDTKALGQNAFAYLNEHYSAKDACDTILKFVG